MLVDVRRRELAESFEFVGAVPHQQVVNHYQQADLFVNLSHTDSLDKAVLEAMALGLPIVATNIPALLEIVEDGRNALLVKSASPAKLAAAIEALLVDQEQATSFGRRSREIFDARFTLERTVARMIELYQGLSTGYL